MDKEAEASRSSGEAAAGWDGATKGLGIGSGLGAVGTGAALAVGSAALYVFAAPACFLLGTAAYYSWCKSYRAF